MARSQIRGITIEIGGDTTRLDKALDQSDRKLRGMQSDLKKVEDALKLDPGNMDLLAEKQRLLASVAEESSNRLATLTQAAEEMNRRLAEGEIDVDQYNAFNQELILAESRARLAEDALRDFREELDRLSDSADDADDDLDDLDDNLDDLDDDLDDLDDSADNASNKFAKLSGIAAGVSIAIGEKLVSAVTGAISSMWGLDEATEEYRVAMGKLNTAFETAGYNIQTAQNTYQDFYRILGDTDTATEASQLLAQLARDEEDLAKWTNIAAGVYGTFGDSIPIEGLIEAANETAKAGEVTGVLADALNWVGMSEDEFNERLSTMADEGQRAQFIMGGLTAAYEEAADKFYANNEAILASRDAQARLDESLGKLGESMSEVKTEIMESGAELLENLTPSLEMAMEAVSGLFAWLASLDPGTLQLLGGVLLAVAAIAPVASAISAISGALSAVSGAVTLLTGGLGALNIVGGLTLVTFGKWLLIIGAVVAAVWLLVEAFNALTGKSKDVSRSTVSTPSIPSGESGRSALPSGYSLRPVTAEDLPHLARGAVVRPNNPFLAVVGDNPEEPEVISPYSTIRKAMDDSLRTAGRSTGTQSPTSAVMQVDGRTFARLEVPYILEEFRRLGVKFSR